MGASARFVVVGGGVVGASVAYNLARRGASVIIVDGGQRGAATSAGAGIICPWTAPPDDACYRLCAEGAAYYPQLLAMLADDGQADSGYAPVGALCVAGDAQVLHPLAALLESRRSSAPGIGEVAALAPGEPARLFPPLAPGLAGVWIGGGARVDGRAIRDCLLRAAVARGARRLPGTATLDRAGGRVTGVRVGDDRIAADTVVVAAGAWTAQVCAPLGIRLPVSPQRGQIVHARLPGTDTTGWPVVLSDRDPYLVAFPAGRIVLGATREQAGFSYHTTVGGVGGLLAGAAALAPGLRKAELLETRIGFRPVTSNGRPLLGPLAGGLIVATGHGPEGLTAGPYTGLAVAQLALASRRPPTSPPSTHPGSTPNQPTARNHRDRQRPAQGPTPTLHQARSHSQPRRQTSKPPATQPAEPRPQPVNTSRPNAWTCGCRASPSRPSPKMRSTVLSSE